MARKRDEALELFLKENEGSDLELEFFHIVEDYDALELLVLRLYDVGFRDAETLASLSGMKLPMIERALNNEIFVYSHIDSDTGEITEIGRQTLKENESDALENHVMYLTPRRFQVEAVTGTVIPSYLEEKTDYMYPVLEERYDGIVPQESVEQDEELKKEINERLKEYKHLDILNEGDTIRSIEELRTSQIFYRWAFLTRYKGMKFPMIALRGYKSIEKVNLKSRKKGSYGKHVVIPLSISKTDAVFLNQHGITFDGTIVREDHLFEYLYNSVGTFKLYLEQDLAEAKAKAEQTPDESKDSLKENNTSENT